MLENDCVACDVPPRIERHPAFGVRQDLHPLGIERVETGVGQDAPVGRLQIMQPLDLMFALELAGRFGKGLEAVKEVAQAGLVVRFELRTMAPEEFAGLGIETGESQSLTQASGLGSSRLIGWRIMPHNASPKYTTDPKKDRR